MWPTSRCTSECNGAQFQGREGLCVSLRWVPCVADGRSTVQVALHSFGCKHCCKATSIIKASVPFQHRATSVATGFHLLPIYTNTTSRSERCACRPHDSSMWWSFNLTTPGMIFGSQPRWGVRLQIWRRPVDGTLEPVFSSNPEPQALNPKPGKPKPERPY